MPLSAENDFPKSRITMPVVLAIAVACLSAPAAAASVFDPFLGTWRGNGAVTASDGQTAALRCKMDVTAEFGERANQALRCATTGHVIEINASMRVEAGEIVGSWSNDRGHSGGLRGAIEEDTVALDLTGEGVEAAMRSTLNGCRMTVNIDGVLSQLATLQVDLEKGC